MSPTKTAFGFCLVLCFQVHAFEYESDSQFLSQCKSITAKEPGAIIPAKFTIELPDTSPVIGSVTLSFSIEPDGTIGNVQVVSSTPPHLFSRMAIKTMRDVICEPIVVDGQPIKLENQQIIMHFTYPE